MKLGPDTICFFIWCYIRTDVIVCLFQVSSSYMDDEWFDSFFVDPVLNDKMITDAAQPPHIKSEHSYSSMNEGSLSSSGDLGDIGKLEGTHQNNTH